MNEFSIAFVTTINISSFIYFGLDKQKAKKHQQRISEKLLLTLTFFGGTVGSLFGILIFNHKTNKKSFIFKMLAVMGIQILILYLIYNDHQ